MMLLNVPEESSSSANNNGWRKPDNNVKENGRGDPSGMYMSIALVPTLLQATGHENYALLFSIVSWFCWTSINSKTAVIILSFLLAFLTNFFPSYWKEGSPAIIFFCTVAWLILYKFVHYRTPSTTGGTAAAVVTKGEWIVISELIAVALTEFVFWKWPVAPESLYAYTALAGLVGCGMACGLVDVLFAKGSVLFRLLFVVTIALGTVEGCFWYQQAANNYPFPKCLWWIFGDFLSSVEKTSRDDILQRLLPSLFAVNKRPRFAWLAYWVVTMLATIPLAPATNNTSTILARKWFHLVAVLLFVPATIAAPELQSLSYAVALAVLMLLESTRHYVPWLNDFYKNYLDTSKDETEDSTIVSHMALIAGCAAPLWLVEWYHDDSYTTNNTTLLVEAKLLVQLWGVWTLGIGDAMGAVVGKNFGRHHWGQQHRTLEGSAAMFLSLSLACLATIWFEHHENRLSISIWLPAVVFVTLLEAFTLQIDNLVLPLAGAAMIFVSMKSARLL